MSVLLMRLAGPMQSWGTHSRFTNRDTGLEPSRSGVIGLLCAALGRPRGASLDVFRPLKMAVRVDREGRLMRDYQTAQNISRSNATKGKLDTVLSERFYLADADFLVGLDGDRSFLDELDGALRQPVWPLFLGRKAFVPAPPVVPALPKVEALHDGILHDVIGSFPWQKRHSGDKPLAKSLRAIIETNNREDEPRSDVPLSFISADRRFGVRHVKEEFFPFPTILEPFPESSDVPQQTGA